MIKIITDSASGIGVELAKILGVEVIQIPIIIDEVAYDNDVPVRFDAVLRYMIGNKDVKTSQISPETFRKVFEKEVKQGNEVIYISVSSKLSGTYNSALLAKSMIEVEEKIAIIDSLTAVMGQALLVEDAVVMVNKGDLFADVVEQTEINKRKVKQYIAVDTLEYIHKRGRISNVQYALGNILQMKIILTADEGEIKVVSKVRGQNRTRKWLEEKYAADKENIDFSKPLTICYREDEEVELKGEVFKEIREHNHLKIDISTILLLFTGETAVGIGYFEK